MKKRAIIPFTPQAVKTVKIYEISYINFYKTSVITSDKKETYSFKNFTLFYGFLRYVV